MNTKQVIVMRKDLNMRRGKMCAQASHASMSFLTKDLNPVWLGSERVQGYWRTSIKPHSDEIAHWLNNSFRKITVYVNSEAELDDIHQKAIEKGLISHMIIDNGATEFNGVLTKTCLAIGPHESSKFMDLTDHLPLL